MKHNNLVLAIDTSTHTGSIALHGDPGILGLLSVSVNLTHSEGLMPAVDQLFQQTQYSVDDLTACACIAGPGSYTGLRIGIATTQGLAIPRNLPCVGITSLEVLAWALPHCRYPICPLLPARKGWAYARLYRWNATQPEPVTEELYAEPDELIASIQEPTVFYGPGLSSFREPLQSALQNEFISAPEVCNLPRADILAELAAGAIREKRFCSPHELLPYYLGPSQAEINWKRKTESRLNNP